MRYCFLTTQQVVQGFLQVVLVVPKEAKLVYYHRNLREKRLNCTSFRRCVQLEKFRPHQSLS